ncbi:YmL10, partial [Phlyctochytrium bullatum]
MARRNKPRLVRVNLDTIQHWVDTGRLDVSKVITIKTLVETRCIKKVKDGVVILAKGGHFLSHAINLEVTHASQAAIKIIEKAGGSVKCFDYDRKTLRALLKPNRFWSQPSPSLPTQPNIPARYFDENRQGYLYSKVGM